MINLKIKRNKREVLDNVKIMHSYLYLEIATPDSDTTFNQYLFLSLAQCNKVK